MFARVRVVWLSILPLVVQICLAVSLTVDLNTVPGYSTLPQCARNGLYYYFTEGYFNECALGEDATDYESCLCNSASSSFTYQLNSWRQEFCATVTPGGNQVFDNYCAVLEGRLAPVDTDSGTTTAAGNGGPATATGASPAQSVSSVAPTATGSTSVGSGSTGIGNGGCSEIEGNDNSCVIQAGHNVAIRNGLSIAVCEVWLVVFALIWANN